MRSSIHFGHGRRWVTRRDAEEIARQLLSLPSEASPTDPFEGRPYRATPHLDGLCIPCARDEKREQQGWASWWKR